MGIFDDLAFGFGSGSTKPRVTKKEYIKAKNELYEVHGFTRNERNKVDDIFAPDFNMPVTSSHPKGLEQREIDARIKWMRENKSKHGLSDNRIDQIEETFKKRV